MSCDCFKILLLFALLTETSFISFINADVGEDTWMDPDAWTRDHIDSEVLQIPNDKCCKFSSFENFKPMEVLKGQQQTLAEDAAALLYFKKFVLMLFDRKSFKCDSTQQVCERSLAFTIKLHQMELLEQLQDPRDLDNILTEILNNVRTPNMQFDGEPLFYTGEESASIKTIVFNIVYDMWLLLKTSEIQFLLMFAIVVMIACIISIRFKIGWKVMVFGVIFMYGYLHTYLECNREQEVNKLLEIIHREEKRENQAKHSQFFNFFKGLFYNVEDADVEMLRQSAKLSPGFCRPDHVLIMYFNDIFIKYLQVLIEKCTVSISILNGALGFPYSMLSGFLFIGLIGYILKLTFKYIFSPAAWTQFSHRSHPYITEQADTNSTTSSQKDRISGDNLKILLNAINSAPQRIVITPALSAMAAVSGVENIEEKPLEKTLQDPSKSGFEKNENTIDSSLDEETEVEIEHVSDDL